MLHGGALRLGRDGDAAPDWTARMRAPQRARTTATLDELRGLLDAAANGPPDAGAGALYAGVLAVSAGHAAGEGGARASDGDAAGGRRGAAAEALCEAVDRVVEARAGFEGAGDDAAALAPVVACGAVDALVRALGSESAWRAGERTLARLAATLSRVVPLFAAFDEPCHVPSGAVEAAVAHLRALVERRGPFPRRPEPREPGGAYPYERALCDAVASCGALEARLHDARSPRHLCGADEWGRVCVALLGAFEAEPDDEFANHDALAPLAVIANFDFCVHVDARVEINHWFGGSHQTSKLSSSVTSMSIRPIFGRIDCSRRVLETRRKSSRRNGRIRSH